MSKITNDGLTRSSTGCQCQCQHLSNVDLYSTFS